MNVSTGVLIKFMFIFFAIFALIFVITLLTPKIAAIVDKIVARIFKNNPARVDDDIYKVKSIYDAQSNETNAEKTAEDKSNDNGDV